MSRLTELTRLREVDGLTVAQAAEVMRISVRQVYRYEKARLEAGGPAITPVRPMPPHKAGAAATRQRAQQRRSRYLELRSTGLPPKAAARRVGVSLRTAYGYEAGLVQPGRLRRSVKHLVQFSTGAASAEVAWRVVEQHGPENVVLLTADTKKEHPDNWRFGQEVADRLGCEWVRVADGRTPMQVGRDERCVPSNRMAVCSKILKRKLLDKYRAEHFDPADTVVYLGYDWTEPHRVEAARQHWAPWTVDCPLTRPPLMFKHQILDLFRQRGIEPPLLYAQGFQHANCSGGCVRGGQAQWALLLRVNRPEYLDWEREEEQTRAELGKDVAILRDRTGGTTKALPLRVFRERLDAQPSLFDEDDWGACGCLIDTPSGAAS